VVLLAPNGAGAGFLPVPVLALGWSWRRVSKQPNVYLVDIAPRSSNARTGMRAQHSWYYDHVIALFWSLPGTRLGVDNANFKSLVYTEGSE
jgi:hypothetical protein